MTLVDTDIIIWYMRGNAKAGIALHSLEKILISAVTHMEVVQGMRDKRELAALTVTLAKWKASVLPINEAISNMAVQLVERHFLSHSLSMADALIGSTALSYRIPLLTANIRHYTVIDGLILKTFNPEV
ncbi:MAG: type II toxin-antitoxin system VapC family toxin [Nitrospinae bacterium]|nr:type II toxin-antitoxin system VapC family toxin [Nitrospinota bacterium]MBF0635092.1 type II toxin-antitoxin system VapC family toxin [Nitrospinota bacterium]